MRLRLIGSYPESDKFNAQNPESKIGRKILTGRKMLTGYALHVT